MHQHSKSTLCETSPAVQWLRLPAFKAGDAGSVTEYRQKVKKESPHLYITCSDGSSLGHPTCVIQLYIIQEHACTCLWYMDSENSVLSRIQLLRPHGLKPASLLCP